MSAIRAILAAHSAKMTAESEARSARMTADVTAALDAHSARMTAESEARSAKMTAALDAHSAKMTANVTAALSALEVVFHQALDHMAKSEIAELEYTLNAPFVKFHPMGQAVSTCGAAVVAEGGLLHLPPGTASISKLLADYPGDQYPIVVGCLHCLTKLSGYAQEHFLSQAPRAGAHPTLFQTSTPQLSNSSSSEFSHVGVVLAYLSSSDFYCAVLLKPESLPVDQGVLQIPDRPLDISYATWVGTISRYAYNASRAASRIHSDSPKSMRATLHSLSGVISTGRLLLAMKHSKWLHASNSTITLSSSQVSHGVAVKPSELSQQENASIAATLHKYPNGAYDYDVAVTASTALYVAAVTPEGTSGSPVFAFEHNYTTGEMQVYQAGIVMAFDARLQQSVISPLWPTVEPMQHLLNAAVKVVTMDIPGWRDCPLHHRVLNVGIVSAVDVSGSAADIEKRVVDMVTKAARCSVNFSVGVIKML